MRDCLNPVAFGVVCENMNSFQIVLHAMFTSDRRNIRTAVFIVDVGNRRSFIEKSCVYIGKSSRKSCCGYSGQTQLNTGFPQG